MSKIRSILFLISAFLLTIVLTASCGSHVQKQKGQDETFRARALLTYEQQREYDQLFLESVRQSHKGNTDAQHELLQRALEINPKASEALYELGLLQVGLSPRTDSALVAQGDSMLQLALELEPSNRFYRQAVAQQMVKRGKYARAVELYEQLAEEKPNSENYSMLLRLYEVTGQNEKALKTVEQIETLEGVDESTCVEKHQLLMRMGKKKEAFEVIEQLIADNPQETRYRVMLGDLYMQAGEKEKGLDIYHDIQQTDPDNRLIKMAILPYYLEEKDTVRFQKEMSAVMLDPKIDNSQKFSLLQSYGRSLLGGATGISKESLFSHFCEALSVPQEDGQLSELCLSYAQAAQLPEDSLDVALDYVLRDNPESLQYRLQKLSNLVKKNDIAEIYDLCVEGEKYNPDVIHFYYYEGLALYTLSQTDEALETFKRGVEIANDGTEPELVSDIFAIMGDIYHQIDKDCEAYAAYDSALVYQPDNIGCLNNYAYFLSLGNKDLDKASEMSKKAVDSDPQNATFLDTYAWILYCKKQYTQARIYIDQTIKALPEEETESPSASNIYEHAGDIYFRCNDKAKALEYWKHALELSEDDEQSKIINRKIKNKKL